MNSDEMLKIVAPALRAAMANESCVPNVRFSSEPISGAAELNIPADADSDKIYAAIAEFAKSNNAENSVNVPGLGAFEISCCNYCEGRMAGKVAVVTGAAQGFGLEIAQGLAQAGAFVVLADINIDGANAAAAKICDELGAKRAAAVAINVTDPASVASAVTDTVKLYGGIDVFVANAGVLKAGSVKTLAEKDFDFVTNVNYKGYFLCVQAVSPVMAAAHAIDPEWMSDIVQINSKSGLEGSNKNGAYAGSKFGGLGLTQSFAMELVTDGIKVNSICPGNFFDGPLWSDPDRGLFVQYLNTGKVPGAKTIEDVKKFYEAKVPMGRGCTTPDVLQAVMYLVDQKYETGQALPVTGGQVMLK